LQDFKDFFKDLSHNRFLKICTIGLIAHVVLSIVLYVFIITILLGIPVNGFAYTIVSFLTAIFYVLFASGILLLHEYFEDRVIIYAGILNVLLSFIYVVNGEPAIFGIPHFTMLTLTYSIFRIIQIFLLFVTSGFNCYIFLRLAQTEEIRLFKLTFYGWILTTFFWLAALIGIWEVYLPTLIIAKIITIPSLIVISVRYKIPSREIEEEIDEK